MSTNVTVGINGSDESVKEKLQNRGWNQESELLLSSIYESSCDSCSSSKAIF